MALLIIANRRGRYELEDHGYETPCWIWQGEVNSRGYGQWELRRHKPRIKKLAHRVFYEHFQGAIPKELELDHLCSMTLCVRPEHLEPVTHLENMRRHQARFEVPGRVRCACCNGKGWVEEPGRCP